MIIKELEIERLLRCPLMVAIDLSQEERCINSLTAWVLRQSFEDKLKGEPSKVLHTIRGKMLEFWVGDKQVAGPLARTAAFRLLNLALDYEVLHLEQPYNLILSGYTIQGKYALLKKRKGEKLPYILIPRTSEPDLKHQQILPPDPITLARFIHAYVNEAHKNVQVLHYPIFRGKPWMNKHINIALAKQYLESIIKVIALKPAFPVMGNHCIKCTTKPCLEVFKLDKITIVGNDGKPKYELTDSNEVIEVGKCVCTDKSRPYEIAAGKKLCLVCDKEIK